jgi:hypothetical protein
MWRPVLNGFVMRILSLQALLVPLASVALLCGSQGAVAKDRITCRDFALAAADDWAAGFMDRASDEEVATEDSVVVISYGKKYLMPRQNNVDGNLRLVSVGERIRLRNKVYAEELFRCMHAHSINVEVNQ